MTDATFNFDLGGGRTLVAQVNIKASVVDAVPVPTPTPTAPPPTPAPTDPPPPPPTPVPTEPPPPPPTEPPPPPPTPAPTPVPTPPPTPAPTPTPPPPPPVPTSPVVHAWVSNPSDAPIAEYVSLGYVFPQGALPTPASTDSTHDQIDVKTRWKDGSVKFAILSGSRWAPARMDRQPADFFPTSGPAGFKADNVEIDPTMILAQVRMFIGRTIYDWSFASIYSGAVERGELVVWRNGPTVTEVWVSRRVPDTSLRVVIGLSKFADGSYCADVTFRNDVAMEAGGGTLQYTAEITVGAAPTYKASVKHFQYQWWRKKIWSDGQERVLHLQHDIAALQAVGAIMPLNMSNPTDVSADTRAMIASGDWRKPLSANGVMPKMGTTGGRPDIGPTTAHNAIWLLKQSRVAQEVVEGQGEAGGAVTWNFSDARGRPLMLGVNVAPTFWSDGRGTPTLAQAPDNDGAGWWPDNAHQPDLQYHLALLTGSRYHLELLQRQAAWAIVSIWPDPRGNILGLVLNWFDQIRAKAWDFLAVLNAATLSPDGTDEAIYFNQILQNNLTYAISQLPAWRDQDGQLAGWISGDYGTPGVIPGWQEDFLASVFAIARRRGLNGVKPICDFMDGFVVGRWLHMPAKFCCTYNIPIYRNGALITRWADLIEHMSGAASWSLGDQSYLYCAMMALYLSESPGAPEAIRRAMAEYGDTEQGRSLSLWVQFDMRKAA